MRIPQQDKGGVRTSNATVPRTFLDIALENYVSTIRLPKVMDLESPCDPFASGPVGTIGCDPQQAPTWGIVP